MTSLYHLFRHFIAYTLSISLVIQPLVAAEAVMNQVNTQKIQQIQHQTDHPGQYALVLLPELWELQDQQSVVLVDNQIDNQSPLGVFYKNQDTLIFQVLTATTEHPIKPSHFHLFSDADGTVTHGALNLLSEGRLSLYQGEYGGATKVQAKNITVKKHKGATQTAKIKGSLLLNGTKRVQNTSPLSIKGHFLTSAPTFQNKSNIKAKGKGRLQIKKGSSHGAMQFSMDSVVTGYGDNTPFESFTNHNKIASKTKLTLNGRHFKQNRHGSCFAGLIFQTSLETLQFQGNFWAPILSLNAQKMLFQGGSLQAYAIYTKTQSWLGKDNPDLKARNGVYIQAKTLSGNGNFEIGGKTSAIPYRHFYDDASRNGKKLRKAGESYFSAHPQEIPSVEGCHLNCTVIDLDEKAKFNVLSGPCKYQGIYTRVRGQINMGSFNHQLMSFINERDLAIPGVLTGFQAEISSHEVDLSGDFKINDLTVHSQKTVLSGTFEGEILRSLGRIFQIAATGSVSYNKTILNHEQINVDGIVKGQNLETHAQNFTVSETGSVSSQHADLDNQQSVIAGQLSTGSMTISGNSVEVPGVLNANQVSNHVPCWSVSGKADIGNFTSITPSLSLFSINPPLTKGEVTLGALAPLAEQGDSCFVLLKKENPPAVSKLDASHLTKTKLPPLLKGDYALNSYDNFKIQNANIQSLESTFRNINIDALILQGNSLHLSGPASGHHWHLNLAHQFKHGDLNLKSLNLTTPSWSQNAGSKMTIGKANVQVGSADLPGNNTINDFNFQGNSLYLPGPTKGHNWSLNLAHQFTHGDLNLSSLNLTVPHWIQNSQTTLQVNQANVQVGSANLQGITKGSSLQGVIDHLNLSGGIESSQVHLQGNHFNNLGWIHNDGGIGLNYNTYDLGNLNTQGTLALTLNDRHIDEYLLKHFENTLGYKMLSLQTNQHLLFTESLELYRSLTLSAPSITFESKSIQETRKIGKGFFRFNIPIWHTPIQNFTVHGDLHLESRDHPLTLSHYNVCSHKGIYNSGSDFILNGSIIAAGNQLLFDVKGNTVLNRTDRPSLLSGGWGGLYGNVAGKFISNASDVHSHDALKIFAHQGFEFNAQEIHHRESHSKRTHWGLGKKTTIHEWNEILRPCLKAAGPIDLITEHGALFDATDLHSPYGITVYAQGPVLDQERLTYDNTFTKKNTIFSSSRSESKTQGDSPTIMASLNSVTVISNKDRIGLPNTLIMAPHVLLEAHKDIRLSVPTLRSEYSYETQGFTFSHALSGIDKDPGKVLLNLNSVTGSLMGLYDARKQNPINQASAAMMTGINGYNAYKGYQKALANKGSLGSYITDGILSRLFTVSFGYHAMSQESYQTHPGQGGIFAEKAILHSHRGNIHTVNGVPLHVDDLTISCPQGSWIRKGFKSLFGGSSESFDMNLDINVLTMTPTGVSMSASSSDYEGTRWINQLVQGNKLTVNARSVVEEGADTHIQYVDDSKVGSWIKIATHDTFNQSQESFGFSLTPTGGSFNINGYGLSYAAPQEGGLGFVGVQVNGNNFVVPMGMGGGSTEKPSSGQIVGEKKKPVCEQPAAIAEEQPYLIAAKGKSNIAVEDSKKSLFNKESVAGHSSAFSGTGEFPYGDGFWGDGDDNYWGDNTPNPVYLKPEASSRQEMMSDIIKSAGRGVSNTVIGLASSVVSFFSDTAVIYAAAAEEAQLREFVPWIDTDDAIALKQTTLYQKADQNMSERVDMFKSAGNVFKDSAYFFAGALYASQLEENFPWLNNQDPLNDMLWYKQSERNMLERLQNIAVGYHDLLGMTIPQKVEIGSGILTSILLPGTLLKGWNALPHMKSVFLERVVYIPQIPDIFAKKFGDILNTQKISKQYKFVSVVKNPKAGRWELNEMSYSGFLSLKSQENDMKFFVKRNSKAPYLVNGHGSPDSVLYERFNVIKNEHEKIKLDHLQLADLIRARPDYKQGTPVMLYSCSVGKKHNGIAQKLANELDVPVQAPSGLITSPNDFFPINIQNVNSRWQWNVLSEHPEIKSLLGEIRTFYPGDVSPFPLRILSRWSDYIKRVSAPVLNSINKLKGHSSQKYSIEHLTKLTVPNQPDILLLPPASNAINHAGGAIQFYPLKEHKVFYRVYTHNPEGRFLTAVPPLSQEFAKEALALPASNEATFIQEVYVPQGIYVERSRTLPAFGKRGGAEQFKIIDEKDLERIIYGPGKLFK